MPSLVISDTLALPFSCFSVPFASSCFRRRKSLLDLVHINVDRIQSLHGCQRSRLTVLYQCAFRHVRLTNATANRRGDFGVSQIDPRSFNGSFRRSYRSIRLLRISQSLIVLLLTDVLSTEQFLITIYRQLRDIGSAWAFARSPFALSYVA